MKHTTTEVVLKNGAKGLLINVPDATVMVSEISFRAGEFLSPREKWETSHLMEHILLGANELVPNARAFLGEFEKNGAYCNASTSAYDITYESECADFEWDRIIGLLLTAITKPLFLEEEFDAEFGNVREEMTARSNNHFRQLSLGLRESFGLAAITDQERVKLMDNVSLEDVKSHYKQTHTTSNMRFVIAGKITPARRKIITGLLEHLELPEGNGRIDLPLERPILLDKPLYIQRESVDNLYFMFDTFTHRQISDAEGVALGLMNIMLTETYYSRIFGTAREKGLVYHISSGHSYAKHSSNWWMGSQVMPKNAEPLFDIITGEMRQIFAGKISAQDITSAKQYALGRFQRGAQTVSGILSGYSNRYYFDDVIENYYDIPGRIEAVTKEEIVSTTNELFEQNTWGLGVLGNAGETFANDLHRRIGELWKQA